MEKALALSCRKAGAGAGGWDPLAAPKAVGSSTSVRPGPLDTELLFGVCPLWPHRAWTGLGLLWFLQSLRGFGKWRNLDPELRVFSDTSVEQK